MKRRHGIGNVIASAVMVFLVVFTVSQLYIYNLDQLDNYNQVAQRVFATNAQKQNEHIEITNVQLNLNHGGTIKVNITLTNAGGVTSHVVEVWLDDADASTSPHARIPQNIFIGPGLSASLTGLDTGISVNLAHKMIVKVFTELGNSASVELLPPGLAGTTAGTLATTLMTIDPPNPITSNNVNVLLTVTNNNQLGVGFTSLQPDICVLEGGSRGFTGTIDSGTISSAGASTLTDSGKSWGIGVLGNLAVTLTSGAGAGQVRIISTSTPNTGQTLTVTSPWSTTPLAGDQYSILSNCHSGLAVTDFGSVTGASNGPPITLTDSSKNGVWKSGQWAGYSVVILSGPGAGETNTVSASTTTGQLTLENSWSPTVPTSASRYAIRNTPCNTNSGSSTAAPISCTDVSGPTPSGITYLPAGGTIQFQWIFTVSTIIADSPITFTASYTNLTMSSGLFSSQIQASTATVRGAGGASGTSGGNFQNAFGSLVNYFLSFQFSQDGLTWSSSTAVSPSKTVMFRVNLTNLSPKTIDFNSTSDVILFNMKSGGTIQFFIVAACVANQPYWALTTPNCSSGGNAVLSCYPSQPYMVGPGQTITLYFGAKGSSGGQCSQTQKLNTSGQLYLGIISLSGSSYTGAYVGPPTGTSSPYTVTLSPPQADNLYTAAVQCSWTSTCSVPAGSKNANSFQITWTGGATPAGATFTWAVYRPSAPYAQAAPYFTVST